MLHVRVITASRCGTQLTALSACTRTFSSLPFLARQRSTQAHTRLPNDSSQRKAQKRKRRRGSVRAMGVASAGSVQSERERIKTELIRATANTQRGRSATEQQQTAILQAAAALEALNPTDSPGTSPLINGRWSLLYQGPEAVTVRREPLEGPFIDFFRPLLGFLFRIQGVFQVIDTDDGVVDNLVEFRFASAVRGSLNVRGTVAAAPATAPGGLVTRVDVAFTAFQLQLGWLRASLPLGWANPQGWVETTYVDEDFRIGHGDKGSIFITKQGKKG